MIAIHTYVPIVNQRDDLDKKSLLQITLSCLLSKNLFREVNLYTTPKIKEQIEYLNLPYNNIITEPFDDFFSNTFSIPKLITYSLQREPFIHFDIDLFPFRLPNDLYYCDVVYSHIDIPVDLNSHVYSHLNLHNVYLSGLNKIIDKLDENLIQFIDITQIPNMSIFGGHHVETISDASKHCLKFYQENRDFFDSDFNNACIIEQLLLPSIIDMMGKDKSKRKFIMEKSDALTLIKDDKVKYPFTFTYNKNKVIINQEKDIYRYVSIDFGFPIHLSNLKECDDILFIIKENIIQNFDDGLGYINKIDELYPQKEKFENINDRYHQYLIDYLNKINKKIINKFI